MSAEILRRAATGLRDEWSGGNEPMGTAWHQERDFHLAVADWLDDIAKRHGPSTEPMELYLHPEDPCEVCEDGGHLSTVCEGCYPTWDGMEAHNVYPCAETKAALIVARAYLGEQS